MIESSGMRPLKTTSPRRRVWRALLSALAGGGVTAASLAGQLSGKALGALPPGSPSVPGAGSVPVTVSESPSGTSDSPAPASGGGQSTTPTATSTTTAPASTSTTPKPAAPAPAKSQPLVVTENPAVLVQRKQKTTNAKNLTPKVKASKGQQTTPGANAAKPAAAAGANNVAPAPQVVAAQAGLLAAELAGSAASTQALAYYRIPLFLLPIYHAAAAQYGVPWQILAAINEIETDYGNDLSVSTAGAVGWMQFMPATWIQYGVDALNAGYADPYNPVDAIFAAARYLRAAGASSNLRAAILAYNHSAEYVSSVLLRAKLISRYPSAVIATLTGLTDGRPPVRNNQLAWNSIARLVSPSSATAQAIAVGGEASSLPPPPAAAAAGGKTRAAAPGPQLLDLLTASNATVVAVQDGRIVKLGSTPELGKYVVLRDVYGDVFTYAGLGSIASTYHPPAPPKVAGTSGGLAAASSADATRKGAAGQVRPVPLTLSVKRPLRAHAPSPALAGGQASRSVGASRAATEYPARGKVRLLAHPGNPDALAFSAAAAKPAAGRSLPAHHALALARGSVVAKGSVLGHVRTPPGAHAGHLRFAIRPAGDLGSIDPRPILKNWSQLHDALHPQGSSGETELLGATASGVFLLSKSELERGVLSDPGITLDPCGRHDIASGAIDKRVLAVLAFLSRSGLKPTVSALRCGHSEYAASQSAAERHAGAAIDISAIDGVPIAAHQGPGTVADVTIRTLLTLQGEFVPHEIISLMHYPGAANTRAMPEQWDHLHIGFRPAAGVAAPSPALAAASRRAPRAPRPASAPLLLGGNLNSAQWGRLITHIGALPVPRVPVKPSASAIRDARRP